jgi:hypothetical protein
LKIKTLIDKTYKQVIVPSLIFSPTLGEVPFSMYFLVDTGASHTTILQGNALKLGINFSKLKLAKKPVLGISGKQKVYELDDVTLAFQTTSKPPSDLVFTKLDSMNVIKPTKKTVPSTMSIMGTDILQRLHFEYGNPKVNLTCKTRNVNGELYVHHGR